MAGQSAQKKTTYGQPQPYNSPQYNAPQNVTVVRDSQSVAEPANTNAAGRTSNVTRFPRSSTATSQQTPTHQTNDQIFNQSYAAAGMQPSTANTNTRPDATQKQTVQYAPPQQQYTQSNIPRIKQNKKKKTKKQKAAYRANKALARVRVSTANMWIGSWAMFWYAAVQLPLAILSTVALGMTAAVYGILENIVEEGGLFSVLGKAVFSATSKLMAGAAHLFGLEFEPEVLLMTPYALVFIFGLAQLLLAWFMYSAIGVRSLSGQAGGVKGLLFILVGAGYAIPILNMFPLIFLWMIAVWRYPK